MPLLRRGRAFLTSAKASADGRAGLYVRGDAEAWLTVVPGSPQGDETLTPTPGTRVDDRERDYLFSAAAFFDAGFGEPLVGDRITETMEGCQVTWEVCERDREPCWRWADADHTRMRVHTRRVAE
jgi:hypothetical protein